MERIQYAVSRVKEERRLDFNANIVIDTDAKTIRIDTHISRNPARAANGGEYYYWETIFLNEWGEALIRRSCSCDFWQPEKEPESLQMGWEEAKAETERHAAKYGIGIFLEGSDDHLPLITE